MNYLNNLFGGMLPVSMTNEFPQQSIGDMLPVSMTNELHQQSSWWYVACIYE